RSSARTSSQRRTNTPSGTRATRSDFASSRNASRRATGPRSIHVEMLTMVALRPPATAASRSDRRTGRIVQGITNDLAGHPLPEHLDLDGAAHFGAIRRHVRVRDRTLDAEAVAAARHPAHDLAIDLHGLRALCDRARVGEHDRP